MRGALPQGRFKSLLLKALCQSILEAMDVMKSAKWVCRQTGCNALVGSPGYCALHTVDTANRFNGLRKAPGSRAFYGSSNWKLTSKAFRKASPLCAGHKAKGFTIKGDLVDHIIDRHILEREGKDPFDWKYLQTLCHSCHNAKLNARRNKPKPEPTDYFAMYAGSSI